MAGGGGGGGSYVVRYWLVLATTLPEGCRMHVTSRSATGIHATIPCNYWLWQRSRALHIIQNFPPLSPPL
jgi:hypothetical protein